MATKFPPPSPPFIAARHTGGRQTPKAIVLHGTVSSDNKGTARNIAGWWHGPSSPVTSAHYIIDPAEAIQAVGDHTVAYHCGYNTGSIALEFCDEQQGPASRWADADSTAILERGARLTAQLCLAYDIAPIRPSVSDLRRKGPHGIYGHDDSRQAFGNTTHTDPRDFPWAKFLDMVRAEIKALRAAANAPAPVVGPVKTPPKRKTFKVLHAPLHGNSATNAEMQRALSRPDVVSVGFTEAYKHGRFLGSRPRWRAVLGSSKADGRGRMVERDTMVLVRKYRKHIAHGIRLACRPAEPAKIAPARYVTWSVDMLDGKPLAHIVLHPHAAVQNAWGTKRAREFRRAMVVTEKLIKELRATHGADLDIVVTTDANYRDVADGRQFTPRAVFERSGMRWVNSGLDWVAHSKGLVVVDVEYVSRAENGQDHPWIEVEFARR